MSKHSAISLQLKSEIEFLRAPEGYIRAGHPRYFTLFGRDALICAWQLLTYDPTIAQSTLRTLAHWQGKIVNDERAEEPGKIIHELFDDGSTPYYGSIDATFLFLMVVALYYQHTRDEPLLALLEPHILQAVEWTQTRANLDGDRLVEYRPKQPGHSLFQSWRDADVAEEGGNWIPPLELVEVQGYAYAALRWIGPILDQLGKTSLAQGLAEQAQALQKVFLEKFWWPQENYFYYLIDGQGRPAQKITSNPGHLLVTGILPGQQAQAVAQRIFQPDIWTPYGIRTDSTTSYDFDPRRYQHGSIWPHDNWIIAQGLRMIGDEAGYEKIRAALLAAYEKLGHMPELYAVDMDDKFLEPLTSNRLQGWASGALLNMMADMV